MRPGLILFIPVLALAASAAEPDLTARQVIERIQKSVGVPWNAKTVDTFKAGNPDIKVTGIATTFAATFDVLERAAAGGKNLIITHEPTFYNHLDNLNEIPAGDPVLAAKQRFIEEHHLVVFRFHDHWHSRNPDGILQGMTEALGWTAYRTNTAANVFVAPETNLDHLAATIREKLHIKTLRVIGNPGLKISRIALLPGAAGSRSQIELLERDDVEVLVIGETREWETAEYARDAGAEGRKKALIILGHVPSEESGMDTCAQWLKAVVPGIPVEFIPAGEPFWTPR
jgi:putative NIF3 family GTP cyclohydrolase 1 type 2